MSHKDETPDINGRDDAEGFKNRLQWWLLCGNLDSANLQDKQSISQNPVYLAIASQKHCEMSAFGSLNFKKDQRQTQFMFYQEWNKDRPLSSTTDITLNGDGWKRQVQTSGGMSGKWGNFDLEEMKC